MSQNAKADAGSALNRLCRVPQQILCCSVKAKAHQFPNVHVIGIEQITLLRRQQFNHDQAPVYGCVSQHLEIQQPPAGVL